MATDWYEIKFLESATNVRAILHKSTGRKPNAGIAREVSVCIQQGRLFFEAAAAAPLQIKPLLVYYGVVAFSQSVIVARGGNSLSTLKHAHGLTDVTSVTARVEELVLRVENAGTFHEFNEALAPLGRIGYYDENSMPQWQKKPFDLADALCGKVIELRDVLARIPGIERVYTQTFYKPSKTLLIYPNVAAASAAQLRIDDSTVFTDRTSLDALTQRLRDHYPFLSNWRLAEATRGWGNSILIFDNARPPNSGKSGHTTMVEIANGFSDQNSGEVERAPPFDILPPMANGFSMSHCYAVQPLEGVQLNEFATQFLGSFLLSSLVRYRPQIWQRAISRSIVEDGPADDRALSLIEKFLDIVLYEFPKMVTRVVDYNRLD